VKQSKSNLKQFFEQAYGKELSDAEAMEYKKRLTDFFAVLIQVDQRENVTKTYGNKQSDK